MEAGAAIYPKSWISNQVRGGRFNRKQALVLCQYIDNMCSVFLRVDVSVMCVQFVCPMATQRAARVARVVGTPARRAEKRQRRGRREEKGSRRPQTETGAALMSKEINSLLYRFHFAIHYLLLSPQIMHLSVSFVYFLGFSTCTIITFQWS